MIANSKTHPTAVIRRAGSLSNGEQGAATLTSSHFEGFVRFNGHRSGGGGYVG